MIAESNRDKKKRSRPFEAADFHPLLEKKPRGRSGGDLSFRARAIAEEKRKLAQRDPRDVLAGVLD